VFADRRGLLLSAIVQGFFLQHAIQGWCPPLPLFRSFGVRSQREIEAERHALKALLGAYEGAESLRSEDQPHAARQILQKAME
jgi:hypothetical protein